MSSELMEMTRKLWNTPLDLELFYPTTSVTFFLYQCDFCPCKEVIFSHSAQHSHQDPNMLNQQGNFQ